MRYLTLGIAATSALMLSLAPLKAQEVIYGDYNGPNHQHGMCMHKGEIDGLGYLAPCPAAKATAKKAAARTHTRSQRR